MSAQPFYKNVARLLFLNVLIKPLWIFGVDRQVQNVVGPHAYGTYFALFNLSLVFSFITDAGLSTMMNRQVASGTPLNMGHLLRLKAALAAVYSVLVLAAAWLSGVDDWLILISVISIQVLLSFFNFLRGSITAHQLFAWDVWLSVLDKVLMLFFFLPLLYTQLFQIPITIHFFLEAQLFCTAIATSAALVIVLKKTVLHIEVRQKTTAILKQVAPYAGIILLMATHNRLDGFLLERLHRNGAYEAGVYAAAYRLLDVANMMGYLVASFLVPFLARHRTDAFLVQQTTAAARFVLLLAGGFITLFVVAFAGPLQHLLYPLASAYTAQVLQLCLPVLPAYLLLHVYSSLLTAFAQLKLFVILLFFAVVINVILNMLLIPKWGAVGCCIAALASQYVCAISVYFFAVRRNGLQHGGKQVVVLVVLLLFLSLLFWVAVRYGFHPLLAFVVGGLALLLALFAYLPFFKRSVRLSG